MIMMMILFDKIISLTTKELNISFFNISIKSKLSKIIKILFKAKVECSHPTLIHHAWA